MQANTIPRLQWCEYAYGSGSKSRESRAMGDSCESGRPTFSLDKCVRPARVGGVVASTKPDSQEASKRKRPKYVIVNESPHVPLVPLGTASPPVLGRASAGPPGDGWCRTPSGGTQGWGRLRRYLSPHAFCGISPWPMWASLRPSNPSILLGGKRPVFGVSRETFFKNGLFQYGLLQEFEDKCRKTVCAAIPRWLQRC